MTWDRTAWADDTAYKMRDYYEANRPLRWWEKRNPPGSWGIISDDLMLGLLNIALNAECEYRAANDPTIPHLMAEKVAIYEEALRDIGGGCCHPARPGYHNNVSMARIAKEALERGLNQWRT